MFQRHPPHIRKKIALICTVVVFAILITVLIIDYSKPKVKEAPNYESKFKDFYSTILENTKSLFNQN